MATLFYEPSTRTRLSFESAMLRLGGSVIGTEAAHTFSSAIKGETLEDTVRMVSTYADLIVLRHDEAGAAARAASVASVPVVNAGDGPGEHPTQALLDLYTIERELGHVEGVRVAFCGDLRFGRTARSLALLLALYPGVRLAFVAPAVIQVGGDILARLEARGVECRLAEQLTDVLDDVDVVYQTRVQKERFTDPARVRAGQDCDPHRRRDHAAAARDGDRDAPVAAGRRDRARGGCRSARRVLPPGGKRRRHQDGAARDAARMTVPR